MAGQLTFERLTQLLGTNPDPAGAAQSSPGGGTSISARLPAGVSGRGL